MVRVEGRDRPSVIGNESKMKRWQGYTASRECCLVCHDLA